MPRSTIPAVLVGKYWTALPHLSYGQWPPHRTALLEGADDLVLSYTEWRGIGTTKGYKTASWLNLTDFRLSSRLAGKIKKAEKAGFEICSGGIELLDDFWLVYARRLHEMGSLPLPKRFFASLLAGFKEGYAEIFVLRMNKVVVGGACNLSIASFYENAWFATLNDYQSQGASYFLHHNMIHWAMTSGHELYSFGRSTTGGGSHKFKKQWSTRDVPLHWLKNGRIKKGTYALQFISPIIKWLPFKLVVFMGSKLAKYIY